MVESMAEPIAVAGHEIRLGPVSYLVLGLVGLRGPSTPYQLKRAAGRTVAYFWEFSHSQLYDEPQRLAAAGLLAEEREEGGRRRRVFSLTEAGRRALERWLKVPPKGMFEYRDLGVLQVFFGDFMSTEDLVALARSQIDLCRLRLAAYEGIAAHNANRPDARRRMLPLEFGFRLTRTALEMWTEIAENPPPASKDVARRNASR